MKKKILTRNKNYNDLNVFIQNRDKSEKKIIFKTVQDKDNNIFSENNKENYFNSIFYHLKTKKTNNADNFTQMILSNNDFRKNESTNFKTNSSRCYHNHSLRNLLNNKYHIKEFSPCSRIFVRSMVKINKPNLLKLLNRDLINSKKSETSKRNIKSRLSFIPTSKERALDEFIFDKSTTSRISNDKKINKNFFKDINNKYKIKHNFTNDEEETNNKNQKDFIKSLKKFPKINISFPLQSMNSIEFDKQETLDKINTECFRDEKLKRKLRKALHFEINSFEYDNGKYIEYQNSLENYINYIYDINIIPHIKNKFLYNKPIYDQRKINQMLISKNAINKEDAKSLNRHIINSIKKEELDNEKMKNHLKKMKELSKSNNYLQKLCLEYEDEDMPRLTSDEMVELSDFFGKNINYKFVNFATNKLKNVVYQESKNNIKRNKEHTVRLTKIIS